MQRQPICLPKAPETSVDYVTSALSDIQERVEGCMGHYDQTVCPRLIGKALFRLDAPKCSTRTTL
eukprot:3245732-Pyramimonas_sp.AAC.2